ncbi:TIGR03032 family protein [Calothrix sp. PCC 7507]|uniref:TIGR03032 family protein n=1 Tax=Calothrix sp. PCC 7507 TaxID=99598 RepID=UPI000A026F77|nr:TIGR03032 family protein [Calothrix sp. PCC 7507]
MENFLLPSDAISSPSLPKLEINCSPHLVTWLQEQFVSLAFTTYQTNRLFFIGCNEQGRVAAHERLFDKPMGMYASNNSIHVSTRYQIWRFENLLAAGESYQQSDCLYIPRTAYTTGDLNVHDVVLDDAENLIFVNTDFSCLATISNDYSFVPLWQPPFISKLAAEDRCHLNGLAMRDGKPRYVTACSSTDTAAGWRNHRVKGGVVIDVQSNDIIATGLSMPHSPRWYNGKLWLLNSGTGEFGYIESGKFVPLTFCPGFGRGLAFWGKYAVVGLSKLRSRPFSGLALETRLANEGKFPQCGLMIIDITNGEIVHWLQLSGVVEELFDVVVLPGVRQPQALGFQSEEIERLVTFPGSGGIVTTKPTAKRPSVGDMAPVAGLPRQLWEGTQDSGLSNASRLNGGNPRTALAPQHSALKYQRVYHLNPSSLADYEAFTFPSLRQRWQTQPQRGELLGTSATVAGEMVAFAVAEMLPEQTAELISLFVTPEYQQQGIATKLLQYLETALVAEGCSQIRVVYQPKESSAMALTPLLQRLGWQKLIAGTDGLERSLKLLTVSPPVDGNESARSQFEQGKQLAQQGELKAAVASFTKAIRLQPDYIAAYNQLGNALQGLGQIEGAIAAYQKLLTINPNVAQAHCNLGSIWQMQGKTQEAIAAYQRAIQLQPNFAVAYLNLGRLYANQQSWLEAKQCLQQAVRLQPESVAAYYNLGNVLGQIGQIEKAIACLHHALKHQPDFVDTWHSLGCLWMAQGDMDKAQTCFQQVVTLQPDYPQVHGNLGYVLQVQGQLTAALENYNHALELNPDATNIFYQREHLRLSLCDWEDYDQRLQTLQQRLQTHLQDDNAHPLLPLIIHSFPVPMDFHKAIARHWARRVAKSIQPYKHLCAFTPPPAPAPKLRLGYISADFRQHAVGTLIHQIFAYHDRSAFEIYAYSLVDASDEFTEKIQAGCDQFVDLSRLSTPAAAARIHRDGIHILIDLAGYTTFSRPEILALQPAPIQIQYLGYPGTMGAEFIQYILADSWLIPAELAPHYSEKLLELPHAFVASSITITDQPLTRADFGLPTDAFVFCCFNRSDKFDPEVFASWMRILQQVPNSVLWLIETTPDVSYTLRDMAQQQGIAPTRLVFTPRLPLAEYLAAYRLADLFLDTFVYNAGATGIHALFAGLPLITRPGKAFVARMGASICAAAGLDLLICDSSAAYEQKAVHLATHPDELAKIRLILRLHHDDLPLFQPQQWITHLETALWQIWGKTQKQ